MHDPSSHSHTVLFWLCIDGRFTISDYIAGRRGCFVRTIVVLLASAVAHLFGERMSRSDWRDRLAAHPLSWRALLPGFISGCITNHGLELRRDSFYKLLANVCTNDSSQLLSTRRCLFTCKLPNFPLPPYEIKVLEAPPSLWPQCPRPVLPTLLGFSWHNPGIHQSRHQTHCIPSILSPTE